MQPTTIYVHHDYNDQTHIEMMEVLMGTKLLRSDEAGLLVL